MNILITGASKGIGIEMLRYFAKNSENKIVALSRNIDVLRNESISSANIFPLQFDLEKDFESDVDLLKNCENVFSRLDILINNAGVLEKARFEDFSEEKARKIFSVNFHGAARTIQTLLPLLKKSDHAHILNIGSMGGFQGSTKFAGLSYYSASKAALASLTECLAEELSEYHISVNMLALGAVQTQMLAEAFPGYQAPVSARNAAEWICKFAKTGHRFFNGKILPVSLSTP